MEALCTKDNYQTLFKFYNFEEVKTDMWVYICADVLLCTVVKIGDNFDVFEGDDHIHVGVKEDKDMFELESAINNFVGEW